MVHYNDLKTTLENEMRRIATFLDAADGEETWPTLVDAAGFKLMHANGATLLSRANLGWDKGADRFVHEGAMGRWREVLTPEEIARYETRARRELSPNLAKWLEAGPSGVGDPHTIPD